MNNKRVYRCAIYTRKSTTDGLEQDFNSLDAQREACEAFIVSQKSQGWKLSPHQFDDGGISGGHINRPALTSMINKIKAKQIDVVVVYKVDRLTRSLTDFAKLVDVFDAHDVSFVSVTQQFNTTSSMGRLTLNVLLSFAQFEREVTAERIRDKIKASKKKGKWMGGVPPLGYDNIDKRLVVNEVEAQTVRQLFDLYLQLRNVGDVKSKADQLGLITKIRLRGESRMRGGIPFSRGHLYLLLNNPVYIGKVKHKKQIYPGEHEAIVSAEVWHAVQMQLKHNAAQRRSDRNRKSSHILTGLVYDETGDLLSPVHTKKEGKVYNYYVSNRLMVNKGKDATGWRLPKDRFEQEITGTLTAFFGTSKLLFEVVQLTDASSPEVGKLLQKAKILGRRFASKNKSDQREGLATLIARIDLCKHRILIHFNKLELLHKLGIGNLGQNTTEVKPLECSVQMRRRGVENRLIIGQDNQSTNIDPNLVKVVARSHFWVEQLKAGRFISITEIAAASNLGPGEVSRLLPLAFLAPDIVIMIMEGRQPLGLTVHHLVRFAPKLPLSWESQRNHLITSS